MGILIDVSHLSEKSFWDVTKISSSPIIATHSNAYEICNNPRNLKDEQIKAIAKSGGIIGICYYNEFLVKENSDENSKADITDIVRQIKYIKNLVGIQYIGLGSDFDGMDYDKTAKGVKNITKIKNIEKELFKEGFTIKEIEMIMWRNWGEILKKFIQ